MTDKKTRGRPLGRGKKLGITIPNDLDKLLDELADLSGTPKATIITDYLVAVQPQIEKTIEYTRAIKKEDMTLEDAKKYFFGVVADYNQQVSDAIRMINSD